MQWESHPALGIAEAIRVRRGLESSQSKLSLMRDEGDVGC